MLGSRSGALHGLSQLPASLHQSRHPVARREATQVAGSEPDDFQPLCRLPRARCWTRPAAMPKLADSSLPPMQCLYPRIGKNARNARAIRRELCLRRRAPLSTRDGGISDGTLPDFRSSSSALPVRERPLWSGLSAALTVSSAASKITFVRELQPSAPLQSGGLPPVHHPPIGCLRGLDDRFRDFFQEELSERAKGAKVFTNTNPGRILRTLIAWRRSFRMSGSSSSSGIWTTWRSGSLRRNIRRGNDICLPSSHDPRIRGSVLPADRSRCSRSCLAEAVARDPLRRHGRRSAIGTGLRCGVVRASCADRGFAADRRRSRLLRAVPEVDGGSGAGLIASCKFRRAGIPAAAAGRPPQAARASSQRLAKARMRLSDGISRSNGA